jgi:hypothetical protein
MVDILVEIKVSLESYVIEVYINITHFELTYIQDTISNDFSLVF